MPLNPESPATENTAPEQNFEHALERLETIVQRMEADRLPLEELLSCYEEGTRLVRVCGEFLGAAEQRIELITREAAGGPPRAVEFNAANVAKLGVATATAAAEPAPPPPNGARRTSKPSSAGHTPPPAAGNVSHNPHEVSLF